VNEPVVESDQRQFLSVPFGLWGRKITAMLSLSTIVIMTGILFAAAAGAFTLLLLFILERALA